LLEKCHKYSDELTVTWRAGLQSSKDSHYLHLQIQQFGENRCTQFRVIVVTHPHTNNARPPVANTQTGPITIHCAAKLSAQCN